MSAETLKEALKGFVHFSEYWNNKDYVETYVASVERLIIDISSLIEKERAEAIAGERYNRAVGNTVSSERIYEPSQKQRLDEFTMAFASGGMMPQSAIECAKSTIAELDKVKPKKVKEHD